MIGGEVGLLPAVYSPAMFLYSSRTGIVYKYAQGCTADSFWERFIPVPISTAHKTGLSTYGILPQPSSGDFAYYPQ